MPSLRRFATALVALTSAAAASPASAQQEDAQLWLQANTNVPIKRKLRLTVEQIARFSDRQRGLFTTEFGGLIGWKVGDGIELGAGYRYVSGYNGNRAADENRLRQQVVATFGRFTTRFRIDERFHPVGDAVGVRVRPLVRYNHPLGDRGRALFVSHESFVLPNSTSWGQRSGYERMRNIVGVALPIRRGIAVDVGYLNQYRLARGGARAQMDHALTVQLTVDLNDLTHPRLDD